MLFAMAGGSRHHGRVPRRFGFLLRFCHGFPDPGPAHLERPGPVAGSTAMVTVGHDQVTVTVGLAGPPTVTGVMTGAAQGTRRLSESLAAEAAAVMARKPGRLVDRRAARLGR
jgi:hypothetical protein